MRNFDSFNFMIVYIDSKTIEKTFMRNKECIKDFQLSITALLILPCHTFKTKINGKREREYHPIFEISE